MFPHKLLFPAILSALLSLPFISSARIGDSVGLVRRQTTTLKAASAASSRYFGAALAVSHLDNDRNFSLFAREQFSGATPENEMKWAFIEPEQDVFTFDDADQIAEFSVANGLLLRGHTLVWHNRLPDFVYTLSGDDLLDAMNNHITNLVTHFRGQAFAWDVANEVLNDNGTLSQSPFFTELGSGFIEMAFRTARAADPTAKLYINDYSTEGINPKSNALLSIVESLKAQGLIDGVGFQSHFSLGNVPSRLQENLQRFVDLGVDVAITELDIRITLPVSEDKLQQQASDYAYVVNACRAVGERCVGITTWGISDIHSWVPSSYPDQGSPLLFDDDYNPKPAFDATIDALLD